MPNCSSYVQYASGLAHLNSTVEDIFASGDLPKIAETLSSMRRCLAVVGDVSLNHFPAATSCLWLSDLLRPRTTRGSRSTMLTPQTWLQSNVAKPAFEFRDWGPSEVLLYGPVL